MPAARYEVRLFRELLRRVICYFELLGTRQPEAPAWSGIPARGVSSPLSRNAKFTDVIVVGAPIAAGTVHIKPTATKEADVLGCATTTVRDTVAAIDHLSALSRSTPAMLWRLLPCPEQIR